MSPNLQLSLLMPISGFGGEMNFSKLKFCSFLFFLVCFSVPVQNAAADDYCKVDLEWDPGRDPDEYEETDMTFWYSAKISFSGIKDGRNGKSPSVIGISYEDDENRPEYFVTEDNTARWLTNVCRYLLKYYHVKLTSDQPSYFISATLRKFWVVENGTYMGKILMDIEVRNQQKRLFWHGPVTGSARYWGSDFDEDTYLNTIGNACIDWVVNFLGSKEIQTALSDRSSQLPVLTGATEGYDVVIITDSSQIIQFYRSRLSRKINLTET